jgi:hypothetical protein
MFETVLNQGSDDFVPAARNVEFDTGKVSDKNAGHVLLPKDTPNSTSPSS